MSQEQRLASLRRKVALRLVRRDEPQGSSNGEVAEWSKAPVSKTGMGQPIESSNLSLSEMTKDSLTVLKRDKRFAPLIKMHGVPDLKRPSTKLKVNGTDAFQALVRSIIHQQVSGAAAATIHARFLGLFPKAKFPTPKMVRKMPFEKMRAAGLSGQKSSYIKDLAEKFSDGTIRHRELDRMESADIVEHLTQVKGIGVWTVHMFLIFTLNRPDVLPTGDLGIRKGFQALYKLKALPEHAQMERLAKAWRGHASVASWYLWRVADEAKVKARPAGRSKRLKRE